MRLHRSFPPDRILAAIQRLGDADDAMRELLARSPKLRSFLRRYPIGNLCLVGGERLPPPDQDCQGVYMRDDGGTVVVAVLNPRSTVLRTLRHEIGHHVQAAGPGIIDREAWALYFVAMGPEWWAEHVRHYAATNQREAWACVFEEFTDPAYRRGDMPIEIEQCLIVATGLEPRGREEDANEQAAANAGQAEH